MPYPLLAPLRLTSLRQIACSEAVRRFASLTCFAMKRSPGPFHVFNSPVLLCCNLTLRSESNGCSSSSLPTPIGAGPFSRRLADLFLGLRATREGTRFARSGEGVERAAGGFKKQ